MVSRIDFTKWQTMRDYARDNDTSVQVVMNKIRRGKIEFWEIPELNNIKLVKRLKRKK